MVLGPLVLQSLAVSAVTVREFLYVDHRLLPNTRARGRRQCAGRDLNHAETFLLAPLRGLRLVYFKSVWAIMSLTFVRDNNAPAGI